MGAENELTERNRALVLEFWKEVYEGRNYEKVGLYFAEDGLYEDVPTPDAGAIGPETVGRRLAIGHEPVESFDPAIHRIVAEGTTVITEHTETWNFHTGEVVPLPFVSVMEVEDGKIKLWRDYSDQNMLMSGVPQWWLDHIAKFASTAFGGDGSETESGN